jgi:tetratricopeptide (TPR) repeat protein
LLAEVRESAARARELDASNGESYLAEYYLLPDWKWSERQAKIDQAIAADPDLAAAYSERAWFFNSVGRSEEALRAARRAVVLEPLNADHWAGLPPLLSALGGDENQREANEIRERLYRIWPQSVEAWWNRFYNAAYAGDASAALEMLDELDSAPVQLDPLAVERWRNFLAARAAGDSGRMRSAALAMRDLIPEHRFSVGAVMSVLSLAGEVDAAFEVAQAIIEGGGMPALFMAPQANMRRDPRFMTLIRSSLIRYWSDTGRWPDFCADPTLPYDCEEAAARALADR